MPIVTVAHSTRYSYKQPVGFGEHRLMVRPRESYDQRLIEARLVIDPEPIEVRWLHDVFGNAVARRGGGGVFPLSRGYGARLRKLRADGA